MPSTDIQTGMTIVVPCYNEERRLSVDVFSAFIATHPGITFLFVNDGSTDGTLRVLEGLRAAHPASVRVLALPKNVGKAEGTRLGLLDAIQNGATCVGYWDADLATPLDAILSFSEVLAQKPAVTMVFGARVQLLGRSIKRKKSRHYVGRAFATLVSMMLRLGIYDTQCGAKLFRVNDALRNALGEPFITRWIFDVELIIRLMKQVGGPQVLARTIHEYPLQSWEDVGGSKVKGTDFLKAPYELLKIWWTYVV